MRLKCAKIHLQASTVSEILPRLYPGPPLKRELFISYVTVQIIINLINFRWWYWNRFQPFQLFKICQ